MLVKNCKIIDKDGKDIITDILIQNEIITKIEKNISIPNEEIIDAEEKYVLPGIIDVHTHIEIQDLLKKKILPLEVWLVPEVV